MLFFFFMPSVFRAARLSLSEKQNEVKDWLPSDFRETAELAWFAEHFVGESFVLATWPGCNSNDQKLKLFEQKLRHESDEFDAKQLLTADQQEDFARAKELSSELGIVRTANDHRNWAGENEKWLRSIHGDWYYITPEGHLYRWDEAVNGPSSAIRAIKRSLGKYQIQGQFVAAFGRPSTSLKTNPFYNDPSLVCAPLFHTVETGESIVSELAAPGGPLWPIDLTDAANRDVVGRRRAMDRLTGALFAPAVPSGFPWTPEAFVKAIPTAQRDKLPENFEQLTATNLTAILEERFDGSLENLRSATTDKKTDVWYAIFDAADVAPPPRLTCVLVTLTEVAKADLAYVLGRGVAGGTRGRLLQLASESGIRPAPPPSVAPPPFDREQPDALGGMPPLRLGGPPVDNIAIDEEGTVTLIRLLGYSLLIGIVLSYLCFHSVKITIMVFICGGSAAMLSMATVWWTGGKVDAILMSMPSLVYVLGLSGAIHVINYYRDEVRDRGQNGAAGRALRHALLPCTLASTTTAIGLASLFTSNLAPISNFGFYAAVGVLATLGILFSYLPAALETFRPDILRNADASENSANEDVASDATSIRQESIHESDTVFVAFWVSVGRWVTRHWAPVTIACLMVLVLGSLGLFKIKTSVQLLKLFDPGSRILRDYGWLEENFGKLVPMEIVVRVPPNVQAEGDLQADKLEDGSGDDDQVGLVTLNMLERAELASRIGGVVRRTLGETGLGVVGQTMSADTFLPPLPEPNNSYDPIRSKFNRDLVASRDELLASDYVRLEKRGPFKESELWRISLRVSALSDVDYGQFISTLRTSVEPIMRAYETRDALIKTLRKSHPTQTGKERVLLVGSERPLPLDEIELLREILPEEEAVDRYAINTEAIFVSTLGELLANERIKRPMWLNPASEDSPIELGSDKWTQLVSHVDAVIWLDDSQPPAIANTPLVNAIEIKDKLIEPTLADGNVPEVSDAGPLHVVYTGVIPVVYKAQRTLLYSLVESIGLAFVLIALVMVMLLNPGQFPISWLSPSNLGNGMMAGAISMIPNVFPVLLVFGIMGHLGIAIDIGTMMTASVAMGVAVDDTIHFLSWFRQNLDKGLSRGEALIETYRRVGPAMTQTTIVGGLGLFVFSLSTFTPTQRFGTLMLTMLAAALVGDLIMLPALLSSPLGRWFKPRVNRPEGSSADGGSLENSEIREPIEESLPSHSSEIDEDADPLDIESDRPPHLKVHFPPGRIDSGHRMKRR